MSSANTGWVITFSDSSTWEEYNNYFKKYPKQSHVKKSFEKDVVNNPFYHPKDRRIVRIGDSKNYRYSKSATRIVYRPDQAKHTVYPLEIGKGTDISYKKRSKR